METLSLKKMVKIKVGPSNNDYINNEDVNILFSDTESEIDLQELENSTENFSDDESEEQSEIDQDSSNYVSDMNSSMDSLPERVIEMQDSPDSPSALDQQGAVDFEWQFGHDDEREKNIKRLRLDLEHLIKQKTEYSPYLTPSYDYPDYWIASPPHSTDLNFYYPTVEAVKTTVEEKHYLYSMSDSDTDFEPNDSNNCIPCVRPLHTMKFNETIPKPPHMETILNYIEDNLLNKLNEKGWNPVWFWSKVDVGYKIVRESCEPVPLIYQVHGQDECEMRQFTPTISYPELENDIQWFRKFLSFGNRTQVNGEGPSYTIRFGMLFYLAGGNWRMTLFNTVGDSNPTPTDIQNCIWNINYDSTAKYWN